MTVKENLIKLIIDMNSEDVLKLYEDIREKLWENIEEIEPDEIDFQMLREIETNPDCKEFISEEDLLKELGMF